MDNPFIKDLLADLAAGNLSEADAAEVRRHLEDDPRLEKFSAFLTRLQPLLLQLGDDFPGRHLTGEEIVSQVLGPLEVGEEEAPTRDRVAWIDSHLESCGECRDLVATVRSADRDSRAPVPVRAAKTSGSPSHRMRLAIAAVFVIVTLGAGVFFSNRPPAPVLTPFRIEAVTRSVDQVTRVFPDPDGGLPPLLLEFDPWVGRPDAADYSLLIKLEDREDPGRNWSVERSAQKGWSGVEKAFLLDWELTGLNDGPYRVEVAAPSGRVIFQGHFLLGPPEY